MAAGERGCSLGPAPSRAGLLLWNPGARSLAAAQLLVASLLAPSPLSDDLNIPDRSGANVSGAVSELFVAGYLADSLTASVCAQRPAAAGEQRVEAALAAIRKSLPAAAYERVATALAEWRHTLAASGYDRLLADLPAALAAGAQWQVPHDIAADRLDRAVRQWGELKLRLPGTGL